MRNQSKLLYLLLILVMLYQCPTEPSKPNYDTELSVHYAGPTFVMLHFSISDSGKSRNYEIKRDEEVVLTGTLRNADTIITDWIATPSTQYDYQLLVKKGSNTVERSEIISTTTMDTTSHDFTWEVDTLGENGTLFDVWVEDENHAIAVGSYDKTWGGEHHVAAVWNGTAWLDSSIGYTWNQTRFIHAFSESDMWSFPGYMSYFNGERWYIYTPENSDYPYGNQIYDGWGTSSSDMYFVGYNGEMIHYNGSSFSKINSPSLTLLRHIDGCTDSETGKVRIWAGGWERNARGCLIEYQNNHWKTVCNSLKNFNGDDRYVDMGSLFIPNDKIGIFIISGIADNYIMIHNQTFFRDYHQIGGTIQNFDMHGKDANDFFIVGDNTIRHYNGITFKNYTDIAQGFRLRGVHQKDNCVFISGMQLSSQRAIVIRGKRI